MAITAAAISIEIVGRKATIPVSSSILGASLRVAITTIEFLTALAVWLIGVELRDSHEIVQHIHIVSLRAS